MNTIKKEATMAEFYDETEEIKSSSTMNEQEVENLSGSNVNDNGDGDFTPSPLQNEGGETGISASDFDEEQAEAECAKLNYQVALAANACREEKFSTDLTTIPEENRFIIIPNDSKKLDNFIKAGEDAVKLATKILNKPNMTALEYHTLHQKTKKQGFIVLDAALKLSVTINNIETHKGMRSDLAPNPYRTKPQILKEDFGLTKKQAERLQRLTAEAVDKEKKFANDNDEIPTLTHALKFVKKDKEGASTETDGETPDENNSDEDITNKIEVPKGKYDIIYADLNRFDENFDLSQAANDNALLYMWVDKSQLATAIDLMNKNGFENVDCSVFIRNKAKKGGKYFQDMHKMVLVGKKGDVKRPFAFKAGSVVYENEIGENNSYAYYESLIKRMYPDASFCNLITQVSSEEIQNAE